MTKHQKLIKVLEKEMTNEEFWAWVISWYDPATVINEVRDWYEDVANEEYDKLPNKFKTL